MQLRPNRNWFPGLCFLLIFVLVFGALGPDFIAAVRSYSWRITPYTIIRSEVGEEQYSRTVTHFVLRVEYTYSFQGREFTSTRFTTGKHQGSTDLSKAERAAARFRSGSQAFCYVNPH